MDATLQRDAEDRRISVNALISYIMTKYIEWDRFRERFDSITLSKQTVTSLLEAADEEKMTLILKELGPELNREWISFVFKKMNLETYLAHLALLCKYGMFAEYEMVHNGKSYAITLMHNMGKKWSNFLVTIIEQSMKTNLSIVPKIESTKNSVNLEFETPLIEINYE